MRPSTFTKTEVLFTEAEIKEILINEARKFLSEDRSLYFEEGECEKVKAGYKVKFEKLD